MVHMFKMMIYPEFFFIFSKFWFFRLLGMSEVEKWPKITKNSFFHALYLRNHTSYHLHVWWICVKGWHLEMVFFLFLKILILGFVSGVEGKKWYKMTKNSVCLTLYPRNRTSICFFKILIFWVQKDKRFKYTGNLIRKNLLPKSFC